MTTDPTSPHKATLRRLADATNTHDPDVISKTFDELMAEDAGLGGPAVGGCEARTSVGRVAAGA
jgi:hypothetical protein